jgi:predicted Zn-dependent protease
MNNSSQSRIEMLRQYLAEDPSDIFSQYALALEYAKAGNYIEAITLLNRLIEKDSDYLPAYYQLGQLCEETGSVEEAKHAYEKGISVARQQKEFKTLNELLAALDSMED